MTEFIKTAEALKIKGLAGSDYSQLLNSVREQATHPTSVDANREGFQFQSSQINRNRAEALSRTQSIDTPTTSHQQQVKEEPDDEQLTDANSSSSKKSNAYGMDNDFIDSMDRQNDDDVDVCDVNNGNQTANSESNEPIAKRAKQYEGMKSWMLF